MDSSLLARLPPEIRNHIYEYALQARSPLTTNLMRNQETFRPLPTSFARKSSLALTKTSKQVRHESLRMFYALNGFEVRMDEHDDEKYVRALAVCSQKS